MSDKKEQKIYRANLKCPQGVLSDKQILIRSSSLVRAAMLVAGAFKAEMASIELLDSVAFLQEEEADWVEASITEMDVLSSVS